MRAILGTHRGGWFTLVLLAVAVVAVAAFALVQLMGRVTVDQPLPTPGSAVDEARPTIAFSISNEERLGDLSITVDGDDVTDRVRSDGNVVRYQPPRLADGRHTVQVRFESSNIISRSVDRSWTFAVDTRQPALVVASPEPRALANRRVVRFRGVAERGSRVVVSWEGGRTQAQVGPRRGWQTRSRLPEGRVDATITAIDRAGNSTRRRRRVLVDTTAPRLSLNGVPGGPRLTETDTPLVYGAVPGDDPKALVYGGSVNGKAFPAVKGRDGAGAAEVADAAALGAETPVLQLDGRRFALAVGELPQGTSTIRVWARDPAGNVARKTTVVNVNTTEVFGGEVLVRGARGADVAALHARLKLAKVYKGKVQDTYGKKTEAAVRRYQGRYRLAKTGLVDQATRKAMVGRIVINLSQLKLRLIRDGRVVTTYPVAIGTTAHPTPEGSYTITDLQTNPAWFPPDSPWAAGLGPIPAGPGNPLGTRWIGTSASAIGIHGTYATSTVGTRASHGCIRMHIPDVEELYEQVALGMDVRFEA